MSYFHSLALFDRTEAWNSRAVQSELTQRVERKLRQHDLRRHAGKRREYEERQRAREAASPAEAICGRKIEPATSIISHACNQREQASAHFHDWQVHGPTVTRKQPFESIHGQLAKRFGEFGP